MTMAVDQELAERGAVLVEPRVLRRVIKGHRDLGGLLVPHDHCYVIGREPLARYLQKGDVTVDLASLPDPVILVSGDRDRLTQGSAAVQTELWRLLFHGRVHARFEELIGNGSLGESVVRQRIEAIGRSEFEEIRSVLEEEDLLVPPVGLVSTYVEFAALYLELTYFAPYAVERTFPAVLERAAVDATISLDIESEALLVQSRPPRAPEQPLVVEPEEVEHYDSAVAMAQVVDASADKAAAAARSRGNLARSAILSARAGNLSAARRDLDGLTRRLSAVLGGTSTAGWVPALLPVARYAATRRSLRFDAGARLLHDLQAACIIAEREYKVLDVGAWLRSLGRKPLIRTLPASPVVRMARRLRAAEVKGTACGLSSPEERQRLAEVLHAMAAAGDDKVRRQLRPSIEAALDEVGMRPGGLPERVGQKKLIDELLDRVVTTGRLSLPDIRDAISRNDLKMSDLTPTQLRRGDQLLLIDRRLADSLDGVYRRGESYLRYLQKFSSVLFGTAIGRQLTLYVLLPLLASFAIVEGLQHMVGPAAKAMFGVEPVISTRWSLLGGAAFLFLVLHVRSFRQLLLMVFRTLGRALRIVFIDVPVFIWTDPRTRMLLATRPFRYGVKPALPAALLAWLLPLVGVPDPLRWMIAGAVFLSVAIAFNSRWGRIAEERFTAWSVRMASRLTSRIIPELIKYTLDLFARMVEVLERAIYRVDEWLRFRKGQSFILVILKGALGTIWAVIAYVLRLYIVLFVEPTINPIKHFPVVTVAAKIILPFIPAMLSGISGPASQLMGPAVGNSFAAFTVLVLPGLAGFLVWEFKENWRLYRATRAQALKPVIIGHHGENMARLLKPGFHSGTIPKLFTKVRRASWRGDEAAVARHHEALHHVEDAIGVFAERQLASMLNEVESFPPSDVAVDHVEIGSNRVRIVIACKSVSSDHAVIRFEQQSGWLIASLPEHGWIAQLDDSYRRIFAVALAGFYKLAGVELVREQLDDVLRGSSPRPPEYDIVPLGLAVRPWKNFDHEVLYDLRKARPRLLARRARRHELVDLRGRHAVFGREKVLWAIWSAVWVEIARGHEPMRIVFGPSLLGAAAPRMTAAKRPGTV